MPDIQVKKRFKPFVQDELPAVAKGTRMLVAHPYGRTECPRAIKGPVTLALGPEGGFIPYEIEMLEKAGFEAVTLGKRILRVEHALPAIIGRLM
jgi:RsmE family RNA methyltransferase